MRAPFTQLSLVVVSLLEVVAPAQAQQETWGDIAFNIYLPIFLLILVIIAAYIFIKSSFLGHGKNLFSEDNDKKAKTSSSYAMRPKAAPPAAQIPEFTGISQDEKRQLLDLVTEIRDLQRAIDGRFVDFGKSLSYFQQLLEENRSISVAYQRAASPPPPPQPPPPPPLPPPPPPSWQSRSTPPPPAALFGDDGALAAGESRRDILAEYQELIRSGQTAGVKAFLDSQRHEAVNFRLEKIPAGSKADIWILNVNDWGGTVNAVPTFLRCYDTPWFRFDSGSRAIPDLSVLYEVNVVADGEFLSVVKPAIVRRQPDAWMLVRKGRLNLPLGARSSHNAD